MVRFGILGCGRIGQVHAGGVSQLAGAQLVAVSDVFADAAGSLAGRYGVDARSSDQIIASDDIDAVIIGTPTDTHLALITQAAQAGKAIFCEKPIERSIENIELCIKVVEQSGVAFMTGFNRRFDPNFMDVRSRITAGEVGDVELVTLLSRDPAPPPLSYIKSSGGLFRDMMIHDFDMARFLLDEEPVSLHALGSSLVDPAIGEAGDVDTAAVNMITASGKICQISNSRRATYGYDQRIEVHGSSGLLRVGNIHENTVEFGGSTGFTRSKAQNFFLERYQLAYRNELEHFIAAIKGGKSPSPSIHDGLRAQILAQAAQQSFDEGVVVKLD